MRHLRGAAITAGVVVVLVIVLAAELRPLLPWLFVLFVFACILKLAIRN